MNERSAFYRNKPHAAGFGSAGAAGGLERSRSQNGLKAGERIVTTYGAGPFVAGKLLAAQRLAPQAIACGNAFGAKVYEVRKASSTSS